MVASDRGTGGDPAPDRDPDSDTEDTDSGPDSCTDSGPDTDSDSDSGPVVESGGMSRRRLYAAMVGLVVLYGLTNLIDVLVGSTLDYEGDAPAAVVLGAAQYNGTPSAVLAGRLDRAAELYLDGRVGVVVVTGGGQDADLTTEAFAGYEYLRNTAGIPDEDLRLEVDGRSTYQSLAATARFLDREGIDSVILVTDPYHSRRSQIIAEQVGLSAEVVPTDVGFGFQRLARETVAVSLGRIIGFRRIDAYLPV